MLISERKDDARSVSFQELVPVCGGVEELAA